MPKRNNKKKHLALDDTPAMVRTKLPVSTEQRKFISSLTKKKQQICRINFSNRRNFDHSIKREKNWALSRLKVFKIRTLQIDGLGDKHYEK